MIITEDVIYVLKTQYQLANPRVPQLTPHTQCENCSLVR